MTIPLPLDSPDTLRRTLESLTPLVSAGGAGGSRGRGYRPFFGKRSGEPCDSSFIPPRCLTRWLSFQPRI